MLSGKKIWKNQDINRKDADSRTNSHHLACFGYEKISSDEKSQKVSAHFDSVARRYDFMNTLLSFGIHCLWKRTAVRLLGLKPGKRVLDVCGGTGDLSILAAGQVGSTGEVILYDINRDMILAGKTQENHLAIRKRIQYIQGDKVV